MNITFNRESMDAFISNSRLTIMLWGANSLKTEVTRRSRIKLGEPPSSFSGQVKIPSCNEIFNGDPMIGDDYVMAKTLFEYRDASALRSQKI
jgi:hypothetical protein